MPPQPTVGRLTTMLLLAVLALSSCVTPKQPTTLSPADKSEAIAAAMSQSGNSYVCGEGKTDPTITSCSCRVKDTSIYSCKGMTKLCKTMGGGDPECSTQPSGEDWCACAFRL